MLQNLSKTLSEDLLSIANSKQVCIDLACDNSEALVHLSVLHVGYHTFMRP